MSLEKVVQCIKENKRFLITSHVNLEGDALGSELACFKLLRRKKKQVVILNQDKVPAEYNFLPHIKEIKNKIQNFSFDAAIILDCSDFSRCGRVRELFSADKITINIDHHISNNNFADINWVEPSCSSTAEMIYHLYKKLCVPLDKDSALDLYTGILTDTGSFRYANTNYRTHLVVAQLLKTGVLPEVVYKNIYQSHAFDDVKLLTRVFPLIRRDREGKLVWFSIPKKILKKSSVSFDLTEAVLAFGRQIKGVEVVVLFKENLGQANQIKVNLRSQGKYDVNRIASFFGGGGHRTASACTLNGNLNDVCKKVLRKIKESLY
ncbi:MAG: bifunctional oligoribonuclease/PAP phosphatase NrnA [Candidatus Omnitrophica bacterium]|nr:bifunctional oligoribonuclease/PAP phosphatase NrnA [Candidatus Omnitrophota bacterium]